MTDSNEVRVWFVDADGNEREIASGDIQLLDIAYAPADVAAVDLAGLDVTFTALVVVRMTLPLWCLLNGRYISLS